MIGKIKKGSGFKGCVNYVLGKEQAVLLHADGVLTESRGDIIRSFCMHTYIPKPPYEPSLDELKEIKLNKAGELFAQKDRKSVV